MNARIVSLTGYIRLQEGEVITEDCLFLKYDSAPHKPDIQSLGFKCMAKYSDEYGWFKPVVYKSRVTNYTRKMIKI